MLNGRWELREGREACDEFREDPREEFLEEEACWEPREGREACDEFREDPREEFLEEEACEEPRDEPREEGCEEDRGEEDREMTAVEKLDWRQLPEFLPSSAVFLSFL